MLNVSEVLTILEKEGLTSSRQVVLRWIRQGDLPAVQKTRKEGYQVAQSDLAEFIARKKESAASTESTEQTTDDYQAGYQAAIKELLEKAMVSGCRRSFSFQEKCQYPDPFSGFQGNGCEKFQHREEQSLLPNRHQESLSPLRTEDTGKRHLCLSFGRLL